MSRFQVPALEPGCTAYVGWDPPLQTFFGQVYRADRDEDDNPAPWVGTSWRELPEVADLERALAGHAALGDAARDRLRRDRSADR